MTNPTTDNIPDGSDALAGCFLAAEYHGGMMTAMYALASSGSLELYPGEGPARIRNELCEAIAIAERDYPDDVDDLRALADWIAAHDDDGEWTALSPARY